MQPNKPNENWTKFPNNILDNLQEFTGSELKVLALMIRKNIGYDKPNKMFSLNYIVAKLSRQGSMKDETGKLGKMSKSTVKKAIDGLLLKGSIEVIRTGDRGILHYDVRWGAPVRKLYRYENSTTTGTKSVPAPVRKQYQVQENILQETKVEENISPVPDVIISAVNYFNKKYATMYHPETMYQAGMRTLGENNQINGKQNDVMAAAIRGIADAKMSKGIVRNPQSMLGKFDRIMAYSSMGKKKTLVYFDKDMNEVRSGEKG